MTASRREGAFYRSRVLQRRTALAASALVLLALLSIPAGAQDLCSPLAFCDRDGDGFVKDHKRCSCDLQPIDCNDDAYDPLNSCDGGGEVSSFLADLTGSFDFGAGDTGATLFTKSRGNRASNLDEEINMLRSNANAAAWDAVFAACTGLFPSGNAPGSFLVEHGNAEIAKSGADIRITFYDFVVDDETGTPASLSLALIGTTLQGPGLLGQPITYTLDSFSIHGQTIQGGPGGKKRCHFGNEALSLLSPSLLQVLE